MPITLSLKKHFIRDLKSENLLEVFMVTAVASVLTIRFLPALTGYPQFGVAGLRITHVLFGGMMMMVSIVIFLSFVNPNDFIFGLCRLRINAAEKDGKKVAMLRELHVFGPEMRIGAKDNEGKKAQHKGLGGKLMEEAERIAAEHGCERMDVISGIGVREYYRNLGYALEGPYMVKKLAEKARKNARTPKKTDSGKS